MQAKQKDKLVLSDRALLTLLEMLEERFQHFHTFSNSLDDLPDETLMESFLYEFTISVLKKRLNGRPPVRKRAHPDSE